MHILDSACRTPLMELRPGYSLCATHAPPVRSAPTDSHSRQQLGERRCGWAEEDDGGGGEVVGWSGGARVQRLMVGRLRRTRTLNLDTELIGYDCGASL